MPDWAYNIALSRKSSDGKKCEKIAMSKRMDFSYRTEQRNDFNGVFSLFCARAKERYFFKKKEAGTR